eukprot:9280172-Pyramimonas_sp.AAC.1
MGCASSKGGGEADQATVARATSPEKKMRSSMKLNGSSKLWDRERALASNPSASPVRSSPLRPHRLSDPRDKACAPGDALEFSKSILAPIQNRGSWKEGNGASKLATVETNTVQIEKCFKGS